MTAINPEAPILNRKITRRRFIKGAAATVGGLALAASGVGAYLATSEGKEQQAPEQEAIIPSSDINKPPVPEPTPKPPEKLWVPGSFAELGLRKGIDIGTDMSSGTYSNRKGRTIMENEFSAVSVHTVGWRGIERVRGQYNFSGGDDQLALAKRNGWRIIGHGVLYPRDISLPDWVKDVPQNELAQVLYKSAFDRVSHFGSDISEWVVLNEPGFKDEFIRRVLGDSYIYIPFEAARAANQNVVRIYNDFANHSPREERTEHSLSVAADLKKRGLVDAVGLQMHMNGARPLSKSELIETMKRYELPIKITELDINMRAVKGTPEERLAKQADMYRIVVEAAIESGVCDLILFWNIGDSNSWLERETSHPAYSKDADPTPWGDNYEEKPAVAAMKQALAA